MSSTKITPINNTTFRMNTTLPNGTIMLTSGGIRLSETLGKIIYDNLKGVAKKSSKLLAGLSLDEANNFVVRFKDVNEKEGFTINRDFNLYPSLINLNSDELFGLYDIIGSIELEVSSIDFNEDKEFIGFTVM
jgi:hypothetical protein